MKSQAGIILITHNFLDLTKPCLESLRRATVYPYKLLVIENNSVDGTLEYLNSLGVKVIASKEDLSIAKAINLGLKSFLADPDIGYIAWIHNDMLFYRGWLTNLIEVLKRSPDIGKVSPYNFRGAPEQYNDDTAARFMRENAGKLQPGHGGPWVMPREVITEVGLFDEAYLDCGGYEDWDYNNRVLEHGYRVMITWSSVVWHPGMGTRKHLDTREAAVKNARLYAAKWGPGPKV